MTEFMVAAAAVALLIISVEAARENNGRGLALVGLANAMMAGAAAAMAGAPYIDCFHSTESGGALAAAVVVRILVDRRIRPMSLGLGDRRNATSRGIK